MCIIQSLKTLTSPSKYSLKDKGRKEPRKFIFLYNPTSYKILSAIGGLGFGV
jgi:hypothetical protein